MNCFWWAGDMTKGAVLFKTFLSENLIASLWLSDVAGEDSIDLVGLISAILSIGNAVGINN